MIVSGEVALTLLRKWHDDHMPVKALLMSGDSASTAVLNGFVDSLTIVGIIISDERNPKSFISVDPSQCESYDYLEAKDIEGQSQEAKQYPGEQVDEPRLSIVFPSNTRLSIFAQQAAYFALTG